MFAQYEGRSVLVVVDECIATMGVKGEADQGRSNEDSVIEKGDTLEAIATGEDLGLLEW